ncbi:IS110 family transposase [Saccharothrix syringae]|uniref:IS110 family transposase n=1 Tax=Saccharothrix syringae TaxID=103733 RepID=UPI001D17065A|nr:IS110 family transposase [Saccharothrix syringae]
MVRERIRVGIDVGKTTHHARAVDESGEVVFSHRVDHGRTATERLIARAGKAAVEVRWALDPTSGAAGLLVVLLLTTGQPVTSASGQAVNRMAVVLDAFARPDRVVGEPPTTAR